MGVLSGALSLWLLLTRTAFGEFHCKTSWDAVTFMRAHLPQDLGWFLLRPLWGTSKIELGSQKAEIGYYR